MKQALNPFLPLDVYIADGEPHVFGDRIYLFGSHDKAQADTYCALGYEIFSAPVNDLTSWTSNGINYEADQDPLAASTNRHYIYAPDCVRGCDGRFYLYYSLSGEKGAGGYYGPISVAVCDTPDGKYQFYGHLKNEDGTIFSDHVMFDPAVINDEGIIRLYYGTFYPFHNLPGIFKPLMRKIQSRMFNIPVEKIKEQKDKVMGACIVELKDDMCTVKTKAQEILPLYDRKSPFDSKISVIPKGGHFLYGHGFFEGSSIRKINGLYYFIYSSMNNHELCYATSRFPDKDFTYGGVIISNGDVGFSGRKEKDRLNYTATNHGSIEQIDGQWYVFYHRQTHGSDYSRQACAEKITIRDDGKIEQVEMTSCGLNKEELEGKGKYPAPCCCNLTNGRMPHGNNRTNNNIPMIYSEDKVLFIKDMIAKTAASYKYFDLSRTQKITLEVRGTGKLSVLVDGVMQGNVKVDGDKWYECSLPVSGKNHSILTLLVERGKIDICSFALD